METMKDRLDMMRRVRNVTMEEIAKELNVSRQTISNWNTGRRKPTGKHLQALAKYLDVSPEWLVFGISKEEMK